MTVNFRILGPERWGNAAERAFSDEPSGRARVLHRAFHERHLPLTPRLAVDLARLLGSSRPDQTLPWGRAFGLCREVLHTTGFGGTDFWRAALDAFPRVVAEPIIRATATSLGFADLHGAAELSDDDDHSDPASRISAFEAKVHNLLANPEAMGKAFWIVAGLTLYAEAQALQRARIARIGGQGPALAEIDPALGRLLVEVEPVLPTESLNPLRRLLSKARSDRTRAGLRPKEGGVTGIRPSRIIEDIPDVLVSQLLMPRELVAHRLIEEGMLVRHRPPPREPKRSLFFMTVSDRRVPIQALACARSAWADAAIRLQLVLAEADRRGCDLVQSDVSVTGERIVALSSDSALGHRGLDVRRLAGPLRVARQFDTGLLPDLATTCTGLAPSSTDIVEQIPDLVSGALAATEDALRLAELRHRKVGNFPARRKLTPEVYERSLILFLLPEDGLLASQARGNLTDISNAVGVRLKRIGMPRVTFAALILPQRLEAGTVTSGKSDISAFADWSYTIDEAAAPVDALASYIGALSDWMIRLTTEALHG